MLFGSFSQCDVKMVFLGIGRQVTEYNESAAGVVVGDRKLYQKARCLLNCIDTESELKVTPSVS